MSKHTFTETEIKQVFQALFLEKKKVKDLENRLVEINRNPPAPKETATQTAASTDSLELIGKLKRLLVAVKKKHEEGLKDDLSSDLLNEIQVSQQKIDQLSAQLKQKENAYDVLSKKFEEQIDQVRRFQEEHKTQLQDFRTLQQNNDNFTSQNAELRQQENNLRKLLTVAQEDSHKIKTLLAQKEKELAKANSESEELQQKQERINQLSEQLKKRQEAYDDLNQKLEEQTDRLRRVEETTKSQQHAFGSLQLTNRSLENQNKALQEQENSLKQNLAITQDEAYKIKELLALKDAELAKISSAAGDLQNIQAWADQLSNQLKQRETAYNDLNIKLKDQTERLLHTEEEFKNQQQTLSALNQTNDTLVLNNGALQEQQKSLQNALRKSVETLQKIKDVLIQKENEIQDFQTKFNQASEQLQQKDLEFANLNKSFESQSEKLSATENELRANQQLINELRKNNQSAEKNVQAKFEKAIEETSQYKHSLSNKDAEIQKYIRTLEEKDAELVSLKSTIEELRSHPKEDIEKLSRLEQHILRSDQSLVRLQSTLKEFKDEAIKYKDLYSQSTTKLQSTLALQNQQKDELNKLKTDSQKVSHGELETLNNKVYEATEQNRLLKQSLEKLNTLVKDKEKRIADLQHFEYTAKKILGQKQDLQLSNEKEREVIKSLESDKENLHTALSESRQHSEQLERVIQFLRERSEEAQLEAKQLREEFLGSQDTLVKINKDLEEAKIKESQFAALLAKEKVLKQDSEEEISALRNQFETLKSKFNESQTNLQKRILELQEISKIVELLEIEKEHIKQNLDQKTAGFEYLHNEVAVIKQTLIRGLREAKELENRYIDAAREKVAILGKAHQLQQQTEKQSTEITLLSDSLRKSTIGEQALRQSMEDQRISMETSFQQEFKNLQVLFDSQIQTLQSSYQHEIYSLQEQYTKTQNEHKVEKADLIAEHAMLRENMEKLHQRKIEEIENKLIILGKDCSSYEQLYNQKEEEIKLYREKTALLDEDKTALSEYLRQTQALLEEKEQQFTGAQQHLAKKVREIATFSEKVEELQTQISDLQSNLGIFKVKNQDLQSTIEVQSQQEKRLQDTLRESNNHAETEIKKWEDKYSQISEKFRSAIIRITELEKLEEKHAQMQNLLSNLGNVLGAPIGLTQPIGMTTQEFKQQPAKKEKPQFGIRESEYIQQDAPKDTAADSKAIEHTDEQNRPYQNLFDMPRTSSKPKQNLFE